MSNLNLKNLSPEEQNTLSSLATIIKKMMVKAKPDQKEAIHNLPHEDIVHSFIHPIVAHYSGNMHFYGEWDKQAEYIWNSITCIALVTYNNSLWMNKGVTTDGTPPNEDTDGWMLFPVKGGSTGIINIIGNNEIVATTKNKVTTLTLSDLIARKTDLETKENYLGLPEADGMLLASDKNGKRFFVSGDNGITGKCKAIFKPSDLDKGMIHIKHMLGQKGDLIYHIYGNDNTPIIPTIIPIDPDNCVLSFTLMLPLEDGSYTLIILKS